MTPSIVAGLTAILLMLAGALLVAALCMFWRGLFPSWAVLRQNWIWAVLLVECWVLAALIGVVSK